MRRSVLVAGGAAVYAGVAAATYHNSKSHAACGCGGGGSGGGGGGGDGQGAAGGGGAADAGAVFDRLAPMYDAAVGSEERFMGYGLMRWWLLRGAEVRAGGGTR